MLTLRNEVLAQMAEADLSFSAARMVVERMESDLRLGAPEPASYAEAKGRLLPQAEQEVIDLARELWRLEERIILARGPAVAEIATAD